MVSESPYYPLVMTNIAMENPNHKMEVYSWENHLFLWAIYTMAMLVITRVYQWMITANEGTVSESRFQHTSKKAIDMGRFFGEYWKIYQWKHKFMDSPKSVCMMYIHTTSYKIIYIYNQFQHCKRWWPGRWRSGQLLQLQLGMKQQQQLWRFVFLFHRYTLW